jgi:hypothetical protein
MRNASILESRSRAVKKFGSLALIAAACVALVSFATAANDSPAGAGKSALYVSNAFTCPTGAGDTAVESGFVVMNTNDAGDLISTVSVKNGVPNATYEIYVNQDPGDCPTSPTGTLTTNKQGNGNTQVVETRAPSATSFWVSAVSGSVVLRSSAVTLD